MVLHGMSLSDNVDASIASLESLVDGISVITKLLAGHPHCDNYRSGACPGHNYTSGMSDGNHDSGESNDPLGLSFHSDTLSNNHLPGTPYCLHVGSDFKGCPGSPVEPEPLALIGLLNDVYKCDGETACAHSDNMWSKSLPNFGVVAHTPLNARVMSLPGSGGTQHVLAMQKDKDGNKTGMCKVLNTCPWSNTVVTNPGTMTYSRDKKKQQ